MTNKEAVIATLKFIEATGQAAIELQFGGVLILRYGYEYRELYPYVVIAESHREYNCTTAEEAVDYLWNLGAFK